MKKIIIGLILLTVLVSTQAISRTATLVCNGCTHMDKRTLALEGGTGDYFIFDFVNRNLAHWSVSGYSAQTIPLSANQADVYQHVQNFYDVNNGSLDLAVIANVFTGQSSQSFARQTHVSTLSTTHQVTAFDVVTTPVIKDQVVTAVANGSSFSDRVNQTMIALRTLISWAGNINVLGTGIRIPVNAQIKVPFPDGSSVVVYFDFSTMSYAYLKGSAKDAVGNPIPEDAISAAGGPGSTQKYLYPSTPAGLESGILGVQHFNELGIAIAMPPVVSGSWVIACTAVGGGGTRCTPQPQ